MKQFYKIFSSIFFLFFILKGTIINAAVFEPYVGNTGTKIYNSASDWQNSSNWIHVSGSTSVGYPVSGDQINFGSSTQYGNNALQVNFDVTSDLGYTGFILSSNSYESSFTVGNGGNISIKSLADNNKIFVNVNSGGTLSVSDKLVLDATSTTITVGGTLNLNGGFELSGGGKQTLNSTGTINVTGDFTMEAADVNINSGSFNISGGWIIPSSSGNNSNELYLRGTMRVGGTVDIHAQGITGDIATKIDLTGGDFGAGDCDDDHPICDHIVASGGDLPVNLIYFLGEKQGENFLLIWETASEQNSERFDIEASNDKRQWDVIGSETAQGNSDTRYKYSFLNEGKQYLYYRLAQYDLDGAVEYFGVVYSTGKDSDTNVSVYPTLVERNGECKVFFSNVVEGQKIQIELLNLQGRSILSESLNNISNNNNYIKVKIPNNINNGIYVLNISVGSEKYQNKLLVK